MRRSAIFSPCGTYRYLLSRRWSQGPRIAWAMLNPSTADDKQDDPTIRRCIGFSRAWGFGAMDVVNLYALRATDPAMVRRHPAPVGPENDEHIAAAVGPARVVVAGWGAFRFAAERAERVHGALGMACCIGTTREGWPRHPLYAASSARPMAYRMNERIRCRGVQPLGVPTVQ